MTRYIELLGDVIREAGQNVFAKSGIGKLAVEGMKAIHYELMEQREDIERLKKQAGIE